MKQIIIIIIILVFGGFVVKAQTQNSADNILLAYQKIAAENNPGLQAKYKEFEAALQKVPQVSSLQDPTFSFGYFISPVETRVGPQRAKFSLTQMFPWFGTLETKADAASLLAEAKYQSFLDARNKLFYEVAMAYYPLVELNQLKSIEQENIEILESYKTITTSKFKNGLSPMTDVLRVDIMLNDAKTTLSILDKKEKPLQVTFNSLLNRNENEEITISEEIQTEYLPENFRRDSMLTNNPILDAIDFKREASKASEIAAQKEGLPKIGVGLDYAIVGKRKDMEVEDNGKNILMPMVSVSIPIFRQKYDAAEKEAQLMQESYSLQKEEAINILTANYESTWFQLQQQQDLIELYNRQIQQTDQTLNLLFSAYSNSGKDFEDVLQMQQQLLKYEKMKATAETQYQTALAKLNYITAKTF